MSEPRRFWGTEAARGLAMISPTAIFAILLLAAPLATTLLYSVFTDGYLVVEPTLTAAQRASEPSSRSHVASSPMRLFGRVDSLIRTSSKPNWR